MKAEYKGKVIITVKDGFKVLGEMKLYERNIAGLIALTEHIDQLQTQPA